MKTPKIIAEIGINHNGQLNIALELIRQAHAAGAWAVKFQIRDVEKVYKHIWNEPRNDGNPYGWKTQGEQKKGIELSIDDYDRIDELCRVSGIRWFASAWDVNSLELLSTWDTLYNKIASPMLQNLDFVKAVAAQNHKTFISIGGATAEHIEQAISIFKRYGTRFVLMHCVVGYPVEYQDCNISRINSLIARAYAGGYQIGYSGHEVGILPSIAAMVLGAEYVERHITLDRSMYGSDQAASLEIAGLKKLVEYSKMFPDVLGDGSSMPTIRELELLEKLKPREI